MEMKEQEFHVKLLSRENAKAQLIQLLDAELEAGYILDYGIVTAPNCKCGVADELDPLAGGNEERVE